MGALALQARTASGHQPHDPVDTLALSPSFSTDRTIFAVSDSFFFDRSLDGGFTWTRMTSGLGTKSPYTAVALSPGYHLDRTLFAATKADGVYRSLDGGASWQKVSLGLDAQGVAVLALAPDFGVLPVVLAAGIDGGLYKGEGADVAWRRVIDPTTRITALAFSPEFATDNMVAAGDDRGRLYYSLDRGESWSEGPPLGTKPTSVIAFSPAFGSDGTIFVGSYGDGVFRSLDRGATFRRVNNGLSDRRITAVRLSPAFGTDFTLFASAAGEALFRSDNRGGAWRKFGAGLYRRDQGVVHYRSLAVSDGFESDGTVFLGAFEGLFQSKDGGRNWSELEVAKPVDMVTGIAVSARDPLDPGLWISTYGGGVYQRSSSTSDWTVHNRGLERPYTYDIAVSPSFGADSTVFAVLLDFVAKSTNAGAAWTLTRIAPAGEVFPTAISLSPTYAADETILLGSRYTGVFRSTDGGSHYANVLPDAGFVISMAISPQFDSDGTAFAGTASRGLYKSLDHGGSWAPANAGLGIGVLALAISPDFGTDHTLLAGTSQGLYRTKDGGASWRASPPRQDLDGAPVVEVAISPDFAHDGFAIAVVRGAGLFQSRDRGDSWAEIASELTAQGFLLDRIRFSPGFASDGRLYATSGAALFESTDRGASWTMTRRLVRYESQTDMVRYQGNWKGVRSDAASSFDLKYSARAGDRCLFTFVGTGVSWIGPKAPLQGIARVYLDSVLQATIDSYSETESHMQTQFAIQGLPRGPHTLWIEATGTKRLEADAANVVVDAFDVVR